MKIRYIIKKKKNLWVAMSLEFGLAAQADTFDSVQIKIKEQIDEYLNEAEHLKRKGPINWFIIYYINKIIFSSNTNFVYEK